MKHYFLVMLGCLMATATATAAMADDAGSYGRLDLSKFPRPQLISNAPKIVDATAVSTAAAAVYLHVRPGDELRWNSRCQAYEACSVPVLFVTENWFANVYLPAVGANDGREQNYRNHVRRERSAERDLHDVHGED